MPKKCNVCGEPLDKHRCTNGRCRGCHAEYCTPGGNTYPGHGLGNPPERPNLLGGDNVPSQWPA